MQPILKNIGPFWEKHPDVYPGVIRFTDTAMNGDIIEYWERDKDGVMVDHTAIAQARLELARAQEKAARYIDKDEEDFDDEYFD